MCWPGLHRRGRGCTKPRAERGGHPLLSAPLVTAKPVERSEVNRRSWRPHRCAGRLAQAAAALHQLQRGLPELLQLLAGHGRQRLHSGHKRRELLDDGVVRGHHAIVLEQLLELRRRCRAKGQQHQPPRCMPLPGSAAGLHAVTGGRSRQLPEGSDRKRRAKARVKCLYILLLT